jgi:hypothetical protein
MPASPGSGTVASTPVRCCARAREQPGASVALRDEHYRAVPAGVVVHW